MKENFFFTLVIAWAQRVNERKNPPRNIDEITEYALRLAQLYGRPKEERDAIRYSGRMVDIGEMCVPKDIIRTPGELNSDNLKKIKRHPEETLRILSEIIPEFNPTSSPYLTLVYKIIRHHHENYDGTGYPDRLSGRNIPIAARILSLVTAYVAMITPTEKRGGEAYSIARAKEEIRKNVLAQFCPDVAFTLLQII